MCKCKNLETLVIKLLKLRFVSLAKLALYKMYAIQCLLILAVSKIMCAYFRCFVFENSNFHPNKIGYMIIVSTVLSGLPFLYQFWKFPADNGSGKVHKETNPSSS